LVLNVFVSAKFCAGSKISRLNVLNIIIFQLVLIKFYNQITSSAMTKTDLLYSELSEKIISSFCEVHRELGRGHSEQVYCEALSIEFGLAGIPFVCEEIFRIVYKGRLLKSHFRADFIVFEKILVEVKAIDQLTRSNLRQAINYLAASGEKLCLIVNFGAEQLEVKRVVL